MLTEKDVEHVAKLARIALSHEEKEVFTHQLANIMDYIDRLGELDTAGVEPMYHVMELNNVFREDREVRRLAPEEVLANAPEREGTFFKVPKILEG